MFCWVSRLVDVFKTFADEGRVVAGGVAHVFRVDFREIRVIKHCVTVTSSSGATV